MVRNELEALTGALFPTSNPKWLDYCELDGFSEYLGIAFETQGPQHTIYDPKIHKTMARFQHQVTRDEMKVRKCNEQEILLLVIHYSIDAKNMRSYLHSRIYDALGKYRGLNENALPGNLKKQPTIYVPEITEKAYVLT